MSDDPAMIAPSTTGDFERLVANLPDVVFRLDRELRHVFITPTIEALTGIPPGGFIGKTARELGIDPAACDVFEPAARRVITSGNPEVIQYADRGRLLRCRLVPEVDEHGRFVALLGITDDITEAKRSEEALRDLEERFRRLVETVPDGIFIAGPEGRYVDVNPAGCEMLGMTRDEVLASTFLDVLAPEEHARLPSAIAVMADGKVHRSEWQFRRKDGSRFVGDLDGRRLSDGSFQGVVRDVTERRRVEERRAADLAALTRMHALSGRVVQAGGIEGLLQETMEAAVAILAADKGTLQLLEGGALRIVAHRGHDRPFLDFFADAEKVPSACGEATRRGERVLVPDVETSPVFAGTASLYVLRSAGVRAVQSTPMRTRSGRLLGNLTTHWRRPYTPDEHDLWRLDLLARQASDLIELKQAEEQRLLAARALELANAELREADRRKDEFLALLGHELRNPLAPIRNSLYILDRAEPGGHQARRAREVANRQFALLTRLVDDLLDATRLSRGKMRLQRRAVDLAALCRRSAEDHRDLLQDRGLDFVVETPGTPVTVDADEARMAQVIGNLLRNAAKFTPGGGQVTLTLAVEGGKAVLRVRDSGAGIDPGMLESLFEPFVQAESTLERTEGGLGLGLALVKSIVGLHGGEVRAESVGRGHGAEFVVRLPLSGRIAEHGSRSGAIVTGGGSRRILVVDDNVDAAESLADLLRLLGHEPLVAHDGPSALARLASSTLDAVFCDIGLPGMSGYEVARVARTVGGNRVRLFALTGYAQPEDVNRALEAGFDAHVSKPPDPERIAQLLGHVATGAGEPHAGQLL